MEKKNICKSSWRQTIQLLFIVLFSEHFCLYDSIWSSWWQPKEVGIIWSPLFTDEKQNKTGQIFWEVTLFVYKQSKAYISWLPGLHFFPILCSLPSVISDFPLGWIEFLYYFQTRFSAFLHITYSYIWLPSVEIGRFLPLLLSQIWFWCLFIDRHLVCLESRQITRKIV